MEASTSAPSSGDERGKQGVPKGKHTAVLDGPSPSWPVQAPRQSGPCLAKYRPWEPTRLLPRKAAYPRRMGFLIEALEQEQVQRLNTERKFPPFQSGDLLEVRMMVPENQRRQYLYRGVCIGRYNKGVRSAFKLYNVYPDGAAVVQHIPLYMPDVLEIKVVGKVLAGSRMKKYHLLENESAKHTYQRQVKSVLAAEGAADGADDAEEAKKAPAKPTKAGSKPPPSK
jgi:large subunit ribosomal protein L19